MNIYMWDIISGLQGIINNENSGSHCRGSLTQEILNKNNTINTVLTWRSSIFLISL